MVIELLAVLSLRDQVVLPSPTRKISVEVECEERNGSSWTVKVGKRISVLLDEREFSVFRYEA